MTRGRGHRATGLYVHVTWHTYRRYRWIRAADVPLVTQTVLDAADRCGVRVHAQSVLADHVHVLLSLNPAVPLTSFVRHAKSESARRINLSGDRGFRWCRGYYAGSVSRDHVYPVRVYIGGQLRRHPDLVPSTEPRAGVVNPGATPRG